MRLIEKAENLEDREIELIQSSFWQAPALNGLKNVLTCNIFHKPLVLAGPKGIGKSLVAIKAKKLVEQNFNLKCSYTSLSKVNSDKIIFNALYDCYILDDFHYFIERIVNVQNREQTLLRLMLKIRDLAKEKPVVLVTEDLPHLYLEEMGIKDDFGLRESFDDVRLIDPPRICQWQKMFELLDVDADELSQHVIYNISHKPRFLIRIVKLLGKSFTIEDLRDKALEFIRKRCHRQTRIRFEKLMENIAIPTKLNIEEFLRLRCFGKLSEEERENFRLCSARLAQEIRIRNKCPYFFKYKWDTNDVFVIHWAFNKKGWSYVRNLLLKLELDNAQIAKIMPLLRKSSEKLKEFLYLLDFLEESGDETSFLSDYKYTGDFWLLIEPFRYAFSFLAEVPTIDIIRQH